MGNKYLSPYEEAKKLGLKSVKDSKGTTNSNQWKRRYFDTSFWPKYPSDALDAHPAAKKAHVYGSSIK